MQTYAPSIENHPDRFHHYLMKLLCEAVTAELMQQSSEEALLKLSVEIYPRIFLNLQPCQKEL